MLPFERANWMSAAQRSQVSLAWYCWHLVLQSFDLILSNWQRAMQRDEERTANTDTSDTVHSDIIQCLRTHADLFGFFIFSCTCHDRRLFGLSWTDLSSLKLRIHNMNLQKKEKKIERKKNWNAKKNTNISDEEKQRRTNKKQQRNWRAIAASTTATSTTN